MPQEFSIYGLSPLRLPNVPQAHTNVEGMATHCVSLVRQKQPSGPYIFGGLCAGGVIAFEMARQLEAVGEKVDWVILLDAINPKTQFRPFLETRDRLKHFLKNAAGTPPAGTKTNPEETPKVQATEQIDQPKPEASHKLTYAAHALRKLIAYEAQHQVDKVWIAARVKLLRQLMKRNQPWPSWLPPLRELDIFMHIKGEYSPPTIQADLVLVRASIEGEGVDRPAHHFVSDPIFGWGGHTKGRMAIVDAAGGHVSMLLDEPWFGELADTLAKILLPRN
jgi:thioesterase domain-containing protein